jgi:uncharacterized protein YndB with AHSA1/START domain
MAMALRSPPILGLIAGPGIGCDAVPCGDETTPSNALTLELSRTLPADREAVWRAMTEPSELAKWWGPKGFTVPEVLFEPRAGEIYRITMQPPEGDPFLLHGEFREVDPPNRLSYTFVYDPPDPDDRDTLVALSLAARGDETDVSFTQGGFATDERLELHRGGWSDSFDRLEDLLG